jgi:hypothetical protein
MGVVLGAILALAAGEVAGLLADQQRSVFDLGDGVLRVEVSADSVSSADLVDASDRLFDLIRGREVTIVFDAHGNDGPRIGIFDGADAFDSLVPADGSVLAQGDYASQEVRVMVRSDSYVARHIDDDGGFGILPDSAVVTGTYLASSAPFDFDYVYNLFSTPNFDGTFYVKGDAESTRDVLELLRSAGLSVALTPVPEPGDYVQSTRGAIQIEVMAGLLLMSLTLIFLDTAAAQRSRWRVSKLFGATPARIGIQEALRSALAVGVGLGVGAILTSLGAMLWFPALVAPPGMIALLVVVCALAAGLLSAPIHFFSSRSTSLVK